MTKEVTAITIDETTLRHIVRESLRNEERPSWWEMSDEENPVDRRNDTAYGCNTFRTFTPDLERRDKHKFMGGTLPTNKKFEREYNRDYAYMLGVDPEELNNKQFDNGFINLSESERERLVVARAIVAEAVNWKGAALGAMMGASVLGGMSSCGGPINPARNTETTQQGGHIDWPDHSDKPWAFQSYIGQTLEAQWLVVQDKYMIKKLVVAPPTDTAGNVPAINADFQDCAWAIAYEGTEQRDKYNVDIYHSHGQPFFDTEYDGECYMELWYDQDESKPMNERAQFIRIYRRPDDARSTRWTVSLDRVKQNNRIDINNDGPNNRH